MTKFPDLLADQVAVLVADAYTGHVFDVDLESLVSKGGDAYKVFGRLELALKWIEETKYLHTDKVLEFTIYGKNHEMVQYINPFLSPPPM